MYSVDPDITVAATLDAAFYRDEAAFARSRERIFARTWQWIGALDDMSAKGSLKPIDLLPGCLDEPLLLARDSKGELRCLSNVCTHRGNILVKEPCARADIQCGYHGRRFDLDGKFLSMPEFKQAKNFPRPEDDLPRVPFGEWAGQGFAAVDPVAPLDAFLGDMRRRIDVLPLDKARFDSSRSHDYAVEANWALYVENYLEELHIPFVHAGLSKSVDYSTYRQELFRYSTLQLALARPGSAAFDLPAGSRDHGKRVAAYYWWIFPNLMLNFYPWGLSLNSVVPEAVDRTRVSFRSFVWDASKLEGGAGSSLDEVEMEDEAVVQSVQRGVRSRLYPGGRYSPTRETGTHHFHRLICEFLEAR